MDTLRVDISYRPLRIAWAIQSGDFNAFRKAIRWSHALWGGRYNPIILVDRKEEADRLIELFRVDIIIPVGDGDAVKSFPSNYPHLINPIHDEVFMKGEGGFHAYSQLLDIQNALVHFQDKPEWSRLKEKKVRVTTWDPLDPLCDVLLVQLGQYPSKEDVGTDYNGILSASSLGIQFELGLNDAIPPDILEIPSISFLSRFGIDRHYKIDSGREYPGFFVGSSKNLDDLITHWNLRACDIPLWFVDPEHLTRYSNLIPLWLRNMQERVANYRDEWNRRVAVWTRQEDLETASQPFGDSNLLRYGISEATWNGLNVKAPIMIFGQASVLGVIGSDNGTPRVSFALPEKPFSSDNWFHSQHLVASISILGGLHRDDRHTLNVPYVPELNEYYARNLHFDFDKLRVEPDGVGIIISATDHDSFLKAVHVSSLVEQLFKIAGYNVKPSSAGLILRQLISRLGRLQGARPLKIAGVRRLIKTFGPNESFTKSGALGLIRAEDPELPGFKFSDHENLFIEPRPRAEKLTPRSVFGYLVEKGMFRIGADLLCPSCSMTTWTSLDELKHKTICAMCGHEYDAARKLSDSDKWQYRRSGILGAEKNAQGAIPVLLTLQQLDASFHSGFSGNMYSTSLELINPATPLENPCETDFVWVISKPYPQKTVVILGECKDQWAISKEDIENLRRVADAFPTKRFETFIVLSKIASFSEEEIQAARSLNDEHRLRAILFTARELEPYRIYEKTKAKTGIGNYGGSPEAMAQVTARLYFASGEGGGVNPSLIRS